MHAMLPRARIIRQPWTSFSIAAVGLARVGNTELDRVYLQRLTIHPISDTIVEALANKCKDVFDALIARGWDVSSNLGHIGDALT